MLKFKENIFNTKILIKKVPGASGLTIGKLNDEKSWD